AGLVVARSLHFFLRKAPWMGGTPGQSLCHELGVPWAAALPCALARRRSPPSQGRVQRGCCGEGLRLCWRGYLPSLLSHDSPMRPRRRRRASKGGGNAHNLPQEPGSGKTEGGAPSHETVPGDPTWVFLKRRTRSPDSVSPWTLGETLMQLNPSQLKELQNAL